MLAKYVLPGLLDAHVHMRSPFMHMAFLPLAVIPEFRITDKGLGRRERKKNSFSFGRIITHQSSVAVQIPPRSYMAA
jgi:predicted amidohydrolase YtcJ